VPVPSQRGTLPAWHALQVALLNVVGVAQVFNRVVLSTDAGGKVVHPRRAIVEPVGHSFR
jgi:hypothetical protein